MITYALVPAHNEATYLPKVLKKLQKITENIIIIDDGSNDQTSQVAKRFTSHVLMHETNLGKGAALKTGCEYAFYKLKAHAVIFLDADDQHDPKEIPLFIKALKEKDVIFGVRSMGVNMPLLRYLWNKMISVMVNILFGMYIPDIPSGYKAMTKKGYKQVNWNSRGYEVEAEIAVHAALHSVRFGTVPIETIYHDEDKGMTFLDGLRIAFSLVRWRFNL
jgi:glycosyltransferase involved in cell wall biosynthesis